ncbi:hypothetical protein RJT34_25244 [Clitoria ternatea]|uniref:Uncharacterized protein n=1 Tax=Clitoria ternatea TaxID=43366 RepID=A0AAN9FPE5_CLITE
MLLDHQWDTTGTNLDSHLEMLSQPLKRDQGNGPMQAGIAALEYCLSLAWEKGYKERNWKISFKYILQEKNRAAHALARQGHDSNMVLLGECYTLAMPRS